MNLLVTGAAGFTGSAHVRTRRAPEEPAAPRATVLDEPTCAGTLDNLELGHPRLESRYGVRGRGFVRTMTEPEARRDTVDIVDDQRGSRPGAPTSPSGSPDLGPRTGRDVSGVPHATSSGETTWYDLAREVFLLEADPDRVHPVGGVAFVRPAPRPAYSALAHGRRQSLGLPPLRDRRSALHEALPRIRKESPA
ncbi:sugar nucleotide-binding protein [Streptomyces cellulosae]|uniref:sugar nucleotide-binding protein n=1 Tax=Streptomyces cellulosae TaxID=1968 RepID=UPI00099D13D9|nr:sugar nucleotide-binding protein [Streptomyces cellulosae]